MSENEVKDAEVEEIKVRSKSQAKRVQATNPDAIVTIEHDTEQIIEDTEVVVSKFAKELDGKSMFELMRLHDAAILAEDAAKRELHLLRLRAANMATTADDEIERIITAAKKNLVDITEWLHAVETKLWGVPRDIWGSKYGRSE